MFQVLNGVTDSIQHAMQNPFGLDFEVQGKNIYVPLGSVINCLGYNDYLERMVGVARVAFALIAIVKSHDMKERMIATGHIFRGILEMMGNFENYLLVLDIGFTIYNIGSKLLFKPRNLNSELVVGI